MKIYASQTNIFDKVCEGTATSPDEVFPLNRRLEAGESVYATQEVPGDSPGGVVPSFEIVQPAPDLGEIAALTTDAHLHACGQCGALGNALPGAEVIVVSATRGQLGTGTVDSETGAARVRFSVPLLDGEMLEAQQAICGVGGPSTVLPPPDLPPRLLTAPTLEAPLCACDRAVLISGVAEGAVVHFFRNGSDYASACFDYARLWFRLSHPLKENETIEADQRFPSCELQSTRSSPLTVQAAEAVPPPVVVGPLCAGASRVRVAGLRFGAIVTIVQATQSNQAAAAGLPIGEAEAWDETCDIPLVEPLDPVRGRYVIAVQTLCTNISRESAAEGIQMPHPPVQAPRIDGPLYECARMVRVRDIHPGARVEIYMSCAKEPGWRMIAVANVYEASADLLVAPPLVAEHLVFVRQIACDEQKESSSQRVARTGDLLAPGIMDCGGELHVYGLVPGARVEIYVNNTFFKDGRSGGSELHIPLEQPFPAGATIKARQLLCDRISAFSKDFVVRNDVTKRRLDWVHTERVCQLTGSEAGMVNNSVAAGIYNTDLGIVVDHDSGDGYVYFFYGDTNDSNLGGAHNPDDYPDAWDSIARTPARSAGPDGPTLDFLHDVDDGMPLPKIFGIHGISQGAFEVPSGGFSHAGKLYLFATTDHYTDTPITTGLGKAPDFMGRSLMVSSLSARQMFYIVPGHEAISDRHRGSIGEFKFINIAPWKIENDDWSGLPDNAVSGGHGLILIGSGRYRESPPYLAYVPLPPGSDPQFSEWRYFNGFATSAEATSLCGAPLWSAQQSDAMPLFDDTTNPEANHNSGVVGELSIAFLPQVGLWVLLYMGVVMRTASYPWGPWSDAVTIFGVHRGRADPGDPSDPRYIREAWAYGPYIVPRFTEYDRLTRQLSIYYNMSTWRPYQVMLMRTVLRLDCRYDPNFKCPISN